MDLDLRQRFMERLRGAQQRANTGGGWFDIHMEADSDRAVLRIYDIVGWDPTAAEFAEHLDSITASEIEVQINSPGGFAYDGIAIYNALRAHPARVTARVDGIAASAASIIAMAGDHIAIMGGAQLMIHDAWGLAIGPASEMRSAADQLDKTSDNAAGIYAQRAGGDHTADEMRGLMRAESFLNGTEAVELGLADEVMDPPRKSGDDGDGPKSLAEMLAAATDDELAAMRTALQTPVADPGDPDPTPVPDLPAEVDREAAERLLASLTLTQEGTT